MSRPVTRRGDTEVVVFGRHPIADALKSDGVDVLRVAIAKDRSVADRKWLRTETLPLGLSLEEVSRPEMDRLTGAPRHDQGMAAVVRLNRVIELDSFIERTKGNAARFPVRVIGLDGVTNSQNVGMIVRSVVAAGLDGFLWPLIGQPWVNGLVVRAASGAIFECPILRCDTIASGVAALQAAGFSVWGLDASAALSIFEVESPHRVAYVLGAETRGLSDEVREQSDGLVRIPMSDGIESLNVAVAAGLVAFHAAGRLAPSGDSDQPREGSSGR